MKKNTRLQLRLAGLLASATLLNGCGGDLEDFVITTQQQQPVQTQPLQPVAPVANNDTVNALGNAILSQSVANGVLANDTLEGASISAFDGTTTEGGTVNLDQDGSFTYTPIFGFTGTDTFTYTLSNDVGDSTATVTINVPNQGFFVNNQAAPGGNGGQVSPFDNLAAAVTAAGSGDIIYVRRGDGTPYVGGFNLPDGVSLIGEGNGLVLAQQIEPEGEAPEIGGIALDGNNTVSGFLFTGAARGVDAQGVENIIVTNNTFQVDSTAVYLSEVDGAITVSNNLVELEGANNGLELYAEGSSTNLLNVNNNRIRLLESGDGNGRYGLYFYSQDSVDLTGSVSGNTFTGSGNPSLENIEYGIYVETYTDTNIDWTFSNNSIDGVQREGAFLEFTESTTLSLTGTGNSATNIADGHGFCINLADQVTANVNLSSFTIDQLAQSVDGVVFNVFGDVEMVATISDSTFSNIGSMGSGLKVEAGDDTTVCLDVTGNIFNGDLSLVVGDDAVMDVEQFSDIESPVVNTFVNPAELDTDVSGNGVINNRLDGFCSTLELE